MGKEVKGRGVWAVIRLINYILAYEEQDKMAVRDRWSLGVREVGGIILR